jgi:hypothetical protein
MKLYEAIEEEERKNETMVEYYESLIVHNTGPKNMVANLVKYSTWTGVEMGLKDFWGAREKQLIDQFIRATLKYGKSQGLSDKYSFENYEDVVHTLFKKKTLEPDVAFELEPGFDFRPQAGKDKFSIKRINYDEKEAKVGKWARKEREELSKL